MLHADGDLVEDGEDKKTCRPDACGNQKLIQVWIVFGNLIERVRNKTAQNKTDTLIQPEGDEDGGATCPQP